MISYGEAIEQIKNDRELIMYREKLHGVESGKRMYITYKEIVFGEIGFAETTKMKIFLFYVNEIVKAWTPSQHDMMENDWIVENIKDYLKRADFVKEVTRHM